MNKTGIFTGLSLFIMLVLMIVLMNATVVPMWAKIVIFVAVTLVLVVMISYISMTPSKKQRWIMQNGFPATATVLGIEDTGSTLNQNPVIILTLQVKPEVGAEFQATIKAVVSRIRIPRISDVIKVKYDPANVSNIVLTKSERMNNG